MNHYLEQDIEPKDLKLCHQILARLKDMVEVYQTDFGHVAWFPDDGVALFPSGEEFQATSLHAAIDDFIAQTDDKG